MDCEVASAPSGKVGLWPAIRTPWPLAEEELGDFLVDNAKQKPYSFPKHKKAIYLLALPIRPLLGHGPERRCSRWFGTKGSSV